MGCESYDMDNGVTARFSEMDEDVCCLCTFPHNDGNRPCADRVRSLAYLGAMFVLAKRGEIEHGEYVYLPHDLPPEMKEAIDKAIPI